MCFKLLILLILISTAKSDDCISVCDCETNSATCYFITQFPEFRSTNWIQTLYIYSSSIEILGIYDDNYESLERLILTNCRFIKCSEIERLTQQRPRIRVLYSEVCVEDQLRTVSLAVLIYNV